MKRKRKKEHQLLLISVIGMFLFNFPLLSTVDRSGLILGIPSLYAYLFFVWIIIIMLTLAVVEKKHGDEP